MFQLDGQHQPMSLKGAGIQNRRSMTHFIFLFLGGVILLQLFLIPGPFRDIGQRNSDETKIPINLTLHGFIALLVSGELLWFSFIC